MGYIDLTGIEPTIQGQVQLEMRVQEDGQKEYLNKIQSGQSAGPEYGLLRKNVMPYALALEDWLKNQQSAVGRSNVAMSLLTLVEPQEITYMTLGYLVDLFRSNPTRTYSVQDLATRIGNLVVDHVEYTQFRRHAPRLVKHLETHTLKKRTAAYHRRRVLLDTKIREMGQLRVSKEAKFHAGLRLVDILIESTGIVEKVRDTAARGIYRVVFHADAKRQLLSAHERLSHYAGHGFPTVIPPRPWTDEQEGGYYTGVGGHKVKAVKSRCDASWGCAESVYDVLNLLQATPWSINRPVLEVALEVAKRTDGWGVIPKPEAVVIPTPPYTHEGWREEYPEEWTAHRVALEEALDEKDRAEGQASALALTLNRAHNLQDLQEFYFCWNADYRGRFYPLQLYLTPQGSDLQKGLLKFARGFPVGESGIRWLAIHGANCSAMGGVDKAPYHERVEWVKQHEDLIVDSGLNPLDGQRFWCRTDSSGSCIHDDPWQFLAFCMEWARFVQSNRSPEFISHLAVSVDGSCNGLQHFAALLRDPIGGAAVNLVPGEKTADVYAQVATLVAQYVHQDLTSTATLASTLTNEDGKPMWQNPVRELAMGWHGRVDRKLVKRGTMTTAYGVTKYGLRAQVEELLKEAGSKYLPGIPKRNYWLFAMYLSEVLDRAIDAVVQAAKPCKTYFSEIARLTGKAGLNLCWTAPSGFKVVQWTPKRRVKRFKSILGDRRIDLSIIEPAKGVDVQKAASRACPNVVHSIDASHLVQTVRSCHKGGITSFSMVHDSFGCPAGQMDIMSRVLREEFVKLYSRDVLGELHAQFLEALPEKLREEAPEPPSKGDFDLSCVLEAPYFFA